MTTVIKPYVDDDYFDLVPRPTKEQRKALKESIEKDGQLEPITVDSTGRILDGHTRFEICQELHLKPKYIVKDFSNDEDKKSFAVTVNLKRRHLNDYQIFELLQKEFDRIQIKTEQERRQRISDIHSGKRVPMIEREVQRSKSIKILHRLCGVKVQTLEQCKIIKDSGNEKIQEQVRLGTLSPRQAYGKLREKNWDKLTKVKRYRSKFGIVFDVMKAIKEVNQIKISEISRSSNMSHYASKEICDLLIKAGLVKFEKEIKINKNYKNKFINQWYVLTEKGQTYYQKCLDLYEFLPVEFAKELQN